MYDINKKITIAPTQSSLKKYSRKKSQETNKFIKMRTGSQRKTRNCKIYRNIETHQKENQRYEEAQGNNH